MSEFQKNKASIKAISYGLLIDIGGSLVFSFLLGIIYGIVLIKQGMPADQITEKMKVMDHWSFLGVFGTIVGVAISFFAGYICASKSITNINRDAVILGAISATFGVAIGFNSYSLIEISVLSAVTVGAVIFGAMLWKKNN